jgi:hypothetical protein
MAGTATTFASANAQLSSGQIDVAPPQRNELGGAQSVLVGHQDRGRVAMAPAVLPSRFHQQIDFTVAKVSALNQDIPEIRPLAATVCVLHRILPPSNDGVRGPTSAEMLWKDMRA